MFVLLASLLLLAMAFGLHLALWRIRLPKRQIPALLCLFVAVFCASLATPFAWNNSLPNILHTALLYFSISLAYTGIYSGIEYDSPTLSLMHLLAKSGMNGVSCDEAHRILCERPFVRTRLDALIRSGLVAQKNGRYILAGKPSFLFRFILEYQKLYGPISPRG